MDTDSLLQSEPVREKSAAASRPLNFLHLTTFYPPSSFGGDAIYAMGLATRTVSLQSVQELRAHSSR
jgi:hypothetical protein